MRVHWCALCRSDSDTPDQGAASVQYNASEMLAACLGEMPRMTRWAEALPTRAARKYKNVGCSFVANHGTQESLYARGLHGGTQLADVYGRRCISAKYHKTKTHKRHYERISRREREENNVWTCPLYLLGAITYEQNKTISGRRSILLCSSFLFI